MFCSTYIKGLIRNKFPIKEYEFAEMTDKEETTDKPFCEQNSRQPTLFNKLNAKVCTGR